MNVRSGSLDEIGRRPAAVDSLDAGPYGQVALKMSNKKADRYGEKLPKI